MASVIPSRPTKLWWLVGLMLLCLCLVVQLPARWIVQKFAPNNPYLQQVSGNLLQGQANWQIMTRPTVPLAGTMDWQWQPWHLFTGKLGIAVTIKTGKTALKGNVKFAKNSWQVSDFNGKIASDTLKQIVNWQLPDTPITVKDASIAKSNNMYKEAKGILNWSGGELGYPSGGRVYKINLPSMLGTLSTDKANAGVSDTAGNTATGITPSTAAGSRLHMAMTTLQGQRLGDIYIDNENMLDIALTQRLLKNMPDYKGQGADDTVVVSLRQPMTSLGN